MAYNIETPGAFGGDEKEQLEQMYRYMQRMADQLNIALEGIGGNDLTDDERRTMQSILDNASQQAGIVPGTVQDDLYKMESLKSLIIKTAAFVQEKMDEYRLNLLRETVAEGQFGKYVRRTGLDVDVTPEGIQQRFSFEEVVQGLKTYEINAKNYIKTGLLRTEGGLPVYGVAVGRDIVTFSVDGTETYHDGNKVAELTADELSFYQNSVKVASYKGSGVSFYQGGVERVKIDSNGVTFLNGTTKLAEILNTALKFYYNGTLRTQMDTEGISFYNGSTMLAKMTGSRLSFYNGGIEIMYIADGKIYTNNDMEIGSGKSIKIGDWTYNSTGATYDVSGDGTKYFVIGSNDPWAANVNVYRIVPGENDLVFQRETTLYGATKFVTEMKLSNNSANYQEPGTVGTRPYSLVQTDGFEGSIFIPKSDNAGYVGQLTRKFSKGYINTLNYVTLVGPSSREVKHDIRPLEDQGEIIDQLEPVSFTYNDDPKERKRFGLIYEDTVQVLPEICTGNEKNKGINYVDLVPVLLKEIQDLRKRVKALEERAEG